MRQRLEPLDQTCCHGVIYTALHQEPLGGAAYLPVVLHAAVDHFVQRLVKVRIVKDQQRVVAAQLEEHALERVRAFTGELLTCARAAGHADRRDLRIMGHTLGHHIAAADKEGRHACRDASLVRQLLQRQHSQRVGGRRLDNDRIAHDQRRRDLLEGQLDREVKRDDARDHTKRLTAGKDQIALKPRSVVREHLAVQVLGALDRCAQQLDAVHGLAARLYDRLCHLLRGQLRNVLRIRFQQVCKTVQDLAALIERHRLPGGLCRERLLDDFLHLFLGS